MLYRLRQVADRQHSRERRAGDGFHTVQIAAVSAGQVMGFILCRMRQLADRQHSRERRAGDGVHTVQTATVSAGQVMGFMLYRLRQLADRQYSRERRAGDGAHTVQTATGGCRGDCCGIRGDGWWFEREELTCFCGVEHAGKFCGYLILTHHKQQHVCIQSSTIEFHKLAEIIQHRTGPCHKNVTNDAFPYTF